MQVQVPFVAGLPAAGTSGLVALLIPPGWAGVVVLELLAATAGVSLEGAQVAKVANDTIARSMNFIV